MIPKLICWLFGHKRIWNDFTGQYAPRKKMDMFGIYHDIPIMIERRYEYCPRCGEKMK